MSNPTRRFSVQAIDVRNVEGNYNDRSTHIAINLAVVDRDDSTYSDIAIARPGDGAMHAPKKSKVRGGIRKRWKRTLAKVSSSTSSVDKESKETETEASSSVETATESAMNVSAMDHVPSPSQVPSRPIFHAIYVDRLLDAGHGLPCWEPKPFPNDVRAKGAVPGDVGTYTTRLGFHKAFNLWDDKEAFLASSRACAATGTTSEDLGGRVIIHRNVLEGGEAIAPGASCSSSPFPGTGPMNQPYLITHEFQYGSAAGAILVPISHADLETTNDIEAMQTYIIQNAEVIYRYVKSIRGIGLDEPLYIVTGCIKCDKWAIAAYQRSVTEGSTQRILRLANSPARTETVGSSAYHWTETPVSSYARTGGSSVEGLMNQNLFIQGFKLSFSQEFVRRMNDNSASSDLDAPGPGGNSDGRDDLSRQEGRDFHPTGGSASQGQGSGDPKNRGHTSRFWGRGPQGRQVQEEQQLSASCTDSTVHRELEVQLSHFPDGQETMLHPCDTINKVLLQMTNADFALSHDDDWRHLFRSAGALACSQSSATSSTTHDTVSAKGAPIGSKLQDPARQGIQQTRSISVINGVACLVPLKVKNSSSFVPDIALEERTSPHSHGQYHRGKTERRSFSENDNKHVASSSGDAQPALYLQKKPGLYEMPKQTSIVSLSKLSISFHEASPRGKVVTPQKQMHKLVAPWKREKPEDPIFQDGDKDDMVLLIVGPSGVGKSMFINEYLGQEVTPVSDGMVSCTQHVSYHPHVLPDTHPTCPGRRVVLIDTPGFDDTYALQYETFRRTSVCLSSAYENRLRIVNIIYLNSVSQKRMFGSMRVDYEVFRKLCGDHASPMVTMATTHWDSAGLESESVGVTRENEFRTKFWKDILDAGANLERVQDYKTDPERIINEVLRRAHEREVSMMSLQIQEDLVERWKRLPDTEAGNQLRCTLAEFEQRLKESEYETDLEKKRQQMVSVKEQLDALDVPWIDRVKDVFRFGRRGNGIRRGDTATSTGSPLRVDYM